MLHNCMAQNKCCEPQPTTRTSKCCTRIVSIDIGIIHMGVVSAQILTGPDCPHRIKTVDSCDLVNIKDLCCECNVLGCTLGHNRADTLDCIDHFIQKYKILLDAANIILIEQQPPTGLQQIQELIRREYKSKVKLISPRSMHCWMNISHLEYEDRKERTEAMARPYLKHMTAWSYYERKHDMADALCFILFYLYKNEEKRQESIRLKMHEEQEQENLEAARKIGFRMEYYTFGTSLNINDLPPLTPPETEIQVPEEVSNKEAAVVPPLIESFRFI